MRKEKKEGITVIRNSDRFCGKPCSKKVRKLLLIVLTRRERERWGKEGGEGEKEGSAERNHSCVSFWWEYSFGFTPDVLYKVVILSACNVSL